VNLNGVEWIKAGNFKLSSESQDTSPARNEKKTQTTSKSKSSNLRIKKTFTDLEKDEFEIEAFEFISNFFKSSSKDLEDNNPHVKTKFRGIDANQFTVTIYIDNSQANVCSIRLNNDRDLGQGITYSHGRTSRNDISDSVLVTDDGYQLFLKQSGFYSYSNENKLLTSQEAAEYFWEKFVSPLQQ
jgi:hypothetical protein